MPINKNKIKIETGGNASAAQKPSRTRIVGKPVAISTAHTPRPPVLPHITAICSMSFVVSFVFSGSYRFDLVFAFV